jgi:S1-C subfamily serine protease
VVAYGFPLSGVLSSTGNATTGSISALAGLRNDARHLQISAPVQHGNSGGPLVDMSGNVVGVIFSKLDALRVARAIKDIPQNINFAIKASVAANFLDASGIKYAAAQAGKELSVPDVVERAMAFAVHVQCTALACSAPPPQGY